MAAYCHVLQVNQLARPSYSETLPEVGHVGSWHYFSLDYAEADLLGSCFNLFQRKLDGHFLFGKVCVCVSPMVQ